MIRALIFDFDGLIVDTETPALESWRRIYAEHGFELGLDVWAAALGTQHGFDALEHLATQVAGVDQERAARLRAEAALVLARRQELKESLSAGLELLPGVRSLLDQADALGMPCAVASSSGARWVKGWLGRLGILERFACVRTADDVTRTKPDPALFLSAAACLGAPPEQCLVLEDSPNGILAAHAAGCPVVAVPGAITGQLALPAADLLIPSLEALANLVATVQLVRGTHRRSIGDFGGTEPLG
jgi:HAD superfamily hydrolase (TIGR01509 family)